MSRAEAAELEEMLRAGPLDLGGDLAVQRPLLEQLMAHPLAAAVTTETSTLGDVPVVDVRVAGSDEHRVLLYFHGGAYALGSAAGGVGLAAELAGRTGMRAVSVDYRLAPESPFPAAIEDARSAYRALLASGVSPDRVVIVGESAGGGLALALLCSLADHGLPAPASVVLFSPWADLTVSGSTIRTKAAADPALTAAALRVRAADYAAGQDPADPRVSPVFADLRDLPPLLIQVGTHEILLADSLRLAQAAALADVTVTLEVTAGVPHVFQGFAAVLDEGRRALDSAGRFIADHCAGFVADADQNRTD